MAYVLADMESDLEALQRARASGQARIRTSDGRMIENKGGGELERAIAAQKRLIAKEKGEKLPSSVRRPLSRSGW